MTYLWDPTSEQGAKALLVCLAAGDEEARASLELLTPAVADAHLAVLALTPQTEETNIGDCLYALSQREDVDESKGFPAGDWSRRRLGLETCQPLPSVV